MKRFLIFSFLTIMLAAGITLYSYNLNTFNGVNNSSIEGTTSSCPYLQKSTADKCPYVQQQNAKGDCPYKNKSSEFGNDKIQKKVYKKIKMV